MKRKLVAAIAVVALLAIGVAGGFMFMWQQPAQNSEPELPSEPQYWITVTATDTDVSRYTLTGQNWTLTFATSWSYGSNAGQPVQNANATIQVTNENNAIVDELIQNTTTTGTVSCNYSSSHAGIFTFNVTKLVSSDGTEWNTTVLDAQASLIGLQSSTLTVWYDTFHSELVDYNTDTIGVTKVTVNVTYLLRPQEGLTLPSWATYSNQTFLPKTVHNADITINKVAAQETATSGIYTADIATWQPTSYLLVQVSQPQLLTTQTGFSVAHHANGAVWMYGLVAAGAVLFGLAIVRVVWSRKKRVTDKGMARNFPFLSGILLAVASAISLYWGLVGLDGTRWGFDWLLLIIFGFASFLFTLVGAGLSLRKKNQPLVIVSVIMPLVLLVVLKAALDGYALATPWLEFAVTLAVVFLGGALICNSDEQFKKQPATTVAIVGNEH